MKLIKKLTRLQRRGTALPLVMAATIVLLAIGTGLLGLGLHSRVFSARTTHQIQARCAADAGLTKALFELNETLRTKPWDDSILPQVTDEPLQGSDATVSYTVTGDRASGYTIQATGKSQHAQKTVTADLRLQGLFEYAVFGKDGVQLYSGATTDWYNYDQDDENLKVGTNSIESGAVDLKTSATINGDVVVGVDGDPDFVVNAASGATITGDTYAAGDENYLPQITAPQFLQAQASQGTIDGNATVSTSGKYDEINLKNSKILTIDGPVTLYITGDVIISNSAELQVVNDDDASLTMYLAGAVEVKNSGVINNLTQDPKRFKIYGLDSCQSIILKNGSDFYGAIYAPNADMEMKNSADAYGSVVAKTFEQKNSAPFNYDASLRDVSEFDEYVRFVVEKWSEQ